MPDLPTAGPPAPFAEGALVPRGESLAEFVPKASDPGLSSLSAEALTTSPVATVDAPAVTLSPSNLDGSLASSADLSELPVDAEMSEMAVAQGRRPGSPSTPQAGMAPLPEGLPSAAELEQTLQRLVRRMAMLIQAEKCVFLLHDKERNLLVARPPALGFTGEQIKAMRVATDQGVSGRVFTTGQPVTVQDVALDEWVEKDLARRLDVRNLISHPLVRETRDEQERVTGTVTVGVIHVINKRGGGDFTAEDVRLLAILSRQVTAVIANAQLYLRLTEEKEQLQATLQSLLTGIIMVESSGHISLINPAARQIFGLDDPTLIGQPYTQAISQPRLVELIHSAVENGVESQIEMEVELPQTAAGGAKVQRIFQCQTSFVRSDTSGSSIVMGVAAIFNDITEIRNVERMKTAFVSTVSHELRTPLTSIKGFTATLLQDTEGIYDKEMRTEFYQIIDSECDRLARLIEDLLNVSRIESGRSLQMHWTLFQPLVVIEKVLQAQRSFTDRHQLVVCAQTTIPEILGDSDKFDQMLTNLISNAVKYSPSGGQVKVEIWAENELLTVAVRDEGIGIPGDKLGRIFEKFERVDDRDTRQAGGTGIGLFLVKHLVERHEGNIWVESEAGKGSSFIFQIPLHPPSAQAEINALDDKARRGPDVGAARYAADTQESHRR